MLEVSFNKEGEILLKKYQMIEAFVEKIDYYVGDERNNQKYRKYGMYDGGFNKKSIPLVDFIKHGQDKEFIIRDYEYKHNIKFKKDKNNVWYVYGYKNYKFEKDNILYQVLEILNKGEKNEK